MALQQTWAERCAEASGPPQRMRIQSANCTIGGNSPTEVLGIIENTPGNTPMNTALGPVRKSPGFASKTGKSENPYEWINQSALYITPTGVDR